MKTSRELAVRIVHRITKEQGYANIVLDTELRQAPHLDLRDRALTTELVYGVIRWQKTLDWYLDQVCKKPMRTTNLWLQSILRIGVYQLLMLDKIPASAAINESVKLAGKYSRQANLPARTAKGFVNGVLRQLDRSRATLSSPATLKKMSRRLAVEYSYPEWLISRWLRRLGEQETRKACLINNQPPPLTLRVNTLKLSLADLQQDLDSHVVTVSPLPEELPGVIISGVSVPVTELPCYSDGACTAQNASSMLIAHILDPQPGENVLEACAGSGTKTTHIGELMKNRGSITAVDLHEPKLRRLRENCARWGVSIAQTFCSDMTRTKEVPGYRQQGRVGFDRVLVDAPCSGLGVLRKHPETKWTRAERDISTLQQLQLQLLLNGANFFPSTGGILVYSTCTTEPEENQEVIAEFLQVATGFRIESLSEHIPPSLHGCVTPEGFLCIDPPQEMFDGFFCAKLSSLKER